MRRLMAAGAVLAPVAWAVSRSTRVKAAAKCLRGRSVMYRVDAIGRGGPSTMPVVMPRADFALFAENHFQFVDDGPTTLEETDPVLVEMLGPMVDRWGARGVGRTAEQVATNKALAQQ